MCGLYFTYEIFGQMIDIMICTDFGVIVYNLGKKMYDPGKGSMMKPVAIKDVCYLYKKLKRTLLLPWPKVARPGANGADGPQPRLYRPYVFMTHNTPCPKARSFALDHYSMRTRP